MNFNNFLKKLILLSKYLHFSKCGTEKEFLMKFLESVFIMLTNILF